MTFFFDKCTSLNIVKAFRLLGETNVVFLTEELPEDADDTAVIMPHCAEKGYILVSRDEKMAKRLVPLNAVSEHGIGAFFLRSGELSRWRRFVQLVRAWYGMKETSETAERPFVFIVGVNGDHFTPIQLP
jgi:hypothetical protein